MAFAVMALVTGVVATVVYGLLASRWPAATPRAFLVLGVGLAISLSLAAAVARPAAGLGGLAQRPPGSGDPAAAFASRLEQRLPGWMERYGVPGVAVALVDDAEVVWAEAFGYADAERRRGLGVDALFRVESISKSVSAWGVMKLVERGRVGLDDPVLAHLDAGTHPELAGLGPEVTVARLLTNSAGLPLGPIGEEYAPGAALPSLGEFLAREARLVAEPGTRFMYSNVGYALLELLVEEVTGRDFADYMRDEVLLPLGMRDSTFAWDDAHGAAMPTGYDLRCSPVAPYLYPARASGGLLATVEDVGRFVAASVAEPGAADAWPLEPESVRELQRPRVPVAGLFGFVADGYAAGHFVEELQGGRRAVWHGGQGHGWMSHFHAVPEAGVGIVILTNSQRSWPLMAEVLDDWARWHGLGRVGMSAITTAAVALRVLAGASAVAVMWLLLRTAIGLATGARRWEPFSRAHLRSRAVRVALGMAGSAALAWAAFQPYLFVSSVFPDLVGSAAASFAALAAALIVSALFPPRRAASWSGSGASRLAGSDPAPGYGRA